jgi:hypothetical protein
VGLSAHVTAACCCVSRSIPLIQIDEKLGGDGTTDIDDRRSRSRSGSRIRNRGGGETGSNCWPRSHASMILAREPIKESKTNKRIEESGTELTVLDL